MSQSVVTYISVCTTAVCRCKNLIRHIGLSMGVEPAKPWVKGQGLFCSLQSGIKKLTCSFLHLLVQISWDWRIILILLFLFLNENTWM